MAPTDHTSGTVRMMSGRTHGPAEYRSNTLVYVQSYFVTIATILGTGILGLPVTLSHSGLNPFLVSFTVCFLIQALVIYFFTDLLQRAYAAQLLTRRETTLESVPLTEEKDDYEDEFEELNLEDDDEEVDSAGPVLAGHVIIPKDINVKPPNLHMMGELFLGCGVRQLFDTTLIIQFIALLISYSLAGSEAYAELIGISAIYVIPFFVWILTGAIILALQFIQPIISVLTFLKGSLLLGTVIVTFLVGSRVGQTATNDFAHIGGPFLMGTVALGGPINLMPFLYAKICQVKKQIQLFRLSVILGLTTCFILNILWCWSVLDIVPQTTSCLTSSTAEQSSLLSTVTPGRPCFSNVSLESAKENGQIATIPLTEIINTHYPWYNWVALLLEVFIMISITVSFLTIGAALHHTLSGLVDSAWTKDKMSTYSLTSKTKSKFACISMTNLCGPFLSLLAFSVVFCVAMLNPKGFENMLEKVASLFINLEVGLFLYLMLRGAYSKENRKLKIPLSMPNWLYHTQHLIPLYFGFAVIYDIYLTIYEMTEASLSSQNTTMATTLS